MSAILLGSGAGLGLGALYLTAGMTGQGMDNVREQRMAAAAVQGYEGSRLGQAADGPGAGVIHPGDPKLAAASAAPLRFALPFDGKRVAPKAKKRSDLECLTQAVYYEARGESPRGQFAVAQVVMNRVKHPAFPKSVCGVVFQGAGRRGCQFSFACDGSMRGGRESMAWVRARNVATRALAGAALADIGAATHFHTTGVSPMWAPQMLRVSQVGVHVFYRFSPRKLRNAPALPQVQEAVLTAGADGEIPALTLTPAVERVIEGTLTPAAAPAAAAETKPVPPSPAPAAEDSAMLAQPPAAKPGV